MTSEHDLGMHRQRLYALAFRLAETASSSGDLGDVLALLASELLRLGVPLVRASCHVLTPHPQYRAMIRVWLRDAPSIASRLDQATASGDAHLNSPFRHVRLSGDRINERLPTTDDRFPVLAELHAEGCTHYFASPLRFSDGRTNVLTWATDAPGGFDEDSLGMFLAVEPLARAAFELPMRGLFAREALEAYIGRQSAARALSGNVQVGEAVEVGAAVLLFDLEGSTNILAGSSPGVAVGALNAFFEAVIGSIQDEGGDVLKLIGDAVLAMFAFEPGGAAGACSAALRAAHEALRRLHECPPNGLGRRLSGRAALHAGDLWFGNVGASGRLDCTVVGPAINLVFRLEKAAKKFQQPVVSSEEFIRRGSMAGRRVGELSVVGFAELQPVWCPMDREEDSIQI